MNKRINIKGCKKNHLVVDDKTIFGCPFFIEKNDSYFCCLYCLEIGLKEEHQVNWNDRPMFCKTEWIDVFEDK